MIILSPNFLTLKGTVETTDKVTRFTTAQSPTPSLLMRTREFSGNLKVKKESLDFTNHNM